MLNSVLDDLSPQVFYSLKKKKRWQELNNLYSILNTTLEDSPCFTMSAIERNSRGLSWYFDDLDDTAVRSHDGIKSKSIEIRKIATKGRDGSSSLSLEDSVECGKRKNMKKKSRKQEVRSREPEVTVIIEQLPVMLCNTYKGCYRGQKKTRRVNNLLKEFLHEEEYVFGESDSEL